MAHLVPDLDLDFDLAAAVDAAVAVEMVAVAVVVVVPVSLEQKNSMEILQFSGIEVVAFPAGTMVVEGKVEVEEQMIWATEGLVEMRVHALDPNGRPGRPKYQRAPL